jgi:hypothetical protein
MFWRAFRASQLTDHDSKISHRQLASTLPAISNRYSNIRNRANPLTTNEKTFSNRYFFPHFGARAAPHQSRPTNRAISIRYKWNSQNHRCNENKGETTFYSIQICPS